MKVSGSYASLIRGVSQQAPEVRAAGQHEEQVNLMSDPVAGLTRRRGTIRQSAYILDYLDGDQAFSNKDEVMLTSGGFREVNHTIGGKDYVVLMRVFPSPKPLVDSLPPVLCFNRTDNSWMRVVFNDAQNWKAAVSTLGVSAAISIGQYLMFAINQNPCAIANTPVFGVAANHKAVVWIRGGAYNRTYTVTTPAGSFSYTSVDASVADAAAKIQPLYIAGQLADAAVAAAYTGVSAIGSHLTFDVTHTAGADISTSDGGDGSLMRAVYSVVQDITSLPAMAVDGQIIKVQPGVNEWFYVKAHAKVETGPVLREVIWREAAGSVQGGLLGLGLAKVVDNELYIGVSSGFDPYGLSHMPAGGVPPGLVSSVAGDAETNVPHRWMGNQITYLGMFQDRLLIGSGAALSVSGAGDYLNFFRSTMTTVPIKDGFEMIAQGGEDDTLRHSVPYNKNLVIFGDKRQYIISGTTALTPTSANMAIMTVYADAATCRPVAAGGQIYYARDTEGSVAVYQIQPGAYVDSAESFPASAQVGKLIPAPSADLSAVANTPSLLIVRSRNDFKSIYVFSYVDQPDGRKQDAWYKWTFAPECGNLVSAIPTPAGILLVWVRKPPTSGLGFNWLVTDLLPLSTEPSTLPFLDSMRPIGQVLGGGFTEVNAGAANWVAAFDNTTDRFLIGERLDYADGMAELTAMEEYPSLHVGIPFESYVVPTNPYTRDDKGLIDSSGRLTVTKLAVNTAKSSGMDWEVVSNGATRTGSFNGRVIGQAANAVGTVPVVDAEVSVPIGRSVKAYRLKLMARKWFPLSMTGIGWIGQKFNRTPRA